MRVTVQTVLGPEGRDHQATRLRILARSREAKVRLTVGLRSLLKGQFAIIR